VEGVVTVSTAEPLRRYEGTRVLVTGHTGFKGTWLSAWLVDLGAEVYGFSLPEDRDPSNISGSTDLGKRMDETFGDVRDAESVFTLFEAARPEIVIHMAAQALVRPSYADPVGTISTNVMGTVNVLEAARKSPDVRAVVAVASDKCYENPDDGRAHTETDPMGGSDPYSASKGAAEIVTTSFRRSFFDDPSAPLLASVRAGNVLGAGDASLDRIVPDVIRTIDARGSILLRNPGAVRPWQHVLEPLRAYLRLGSDLLAGDRSKTGSWNIGPTPDGAVTVAELVDMIVETWGLDIEIRTGDGEGPAEAHFLRLDTTKARKDLGFVPHFRIQDTVDFVVDGYRSLLGGEPLESILNRQTATYMEMG
jgi:CDP-glucose 4,6-dehydratase